MSIKNRLKRLEKKVKDNLPTEMNEAEQKQFIKEKAEAVEMYLKATTKEEKQLASEALERTNNKYNLPKDFMAKYTEEELRKIAKWGDDD